VNSRSRCNSKFRIISSKDLPVGAPEDLKTQAHSEQPKPRNRSCSIHTSFRFMARSVAAPQRRLTACLVRACRQRTQRSLFAVAYCLTAGENPSPHMGVAEDAQGDEFYMRQVGWSVGHPTYVEEFFYVRPISGPRLKWRNRFSVTSGFVRLEAVSIAQYQDRIQRSVDTCSRGSLCPPNSCPVSHSMTG
jgi:hypothetical protein